MTYDYTNPSIWNTIWNRPYANYEKHHDSFWKKIRSVSKGRVADLGCGSASCWRTFPPGITLLAGFDFSTDGIREAKKNCPLGNFYVRDIVDTDAPSAFFDTVILCGVVNYYQNLKALLDEASRIAKPGGKVIITINVIDDFPNRHWDRKRIRKEFGSYTDVIEAEFIDGIGWFVAITKKG